MGFKIETQTTINAMESSIEIREILVHYGERLDGSCSKITTLRDGFLILFTIVATIKDLRRMYLFEFMALTAILLELGLGIPLISEVLATVILSASLVLFAYRLVGVGMVLNTLGRPCQPPLDLIDKL